MATVKGLNRTYFILTIWFYSELANEYRCIGRDSIVNKMLDQTTIIHIASIIEQWCTLNRRQRRANSVKGGLFQNYATQLYFCG